MVIKKITDIDALMAILFISKPTVRWFIIIIIKHCPARCPYAANMVGKKDVIYTSAPHMPSWCSA
jgi:hypothetical protein